MSYAYNPVNGSTHRVVVESVPAQSRVLDVGFAGGYLGVALREKSCEIWGIDLVDRCIESARTAYVATAEVNLDESPLRLPWPETTFDCIAAADVLEHLADPPGALRELLGRLRPGGRLVVSVPNVANASIRLRLLAGRFDYSDVGILDRTHRHLYTYRSARQLLEGCGIEVSAELVGSDRFGALLNRRPRLARLLRGLLAYSIVLVGCSPNNMGDH